MLLSTASVIDTLTGALQLGAKLFDMSCVCEPGPILLIMIVNNMSVVKSLLPEYISQALDVSYS